MTTLVFFLAACGLLASEPKVSSVTPADEATDIAQNTTVQAQLELGDSEIDITSLTDASVVLEGPTGPVAAKRTLEGDTLTLAPSSYLAPNTTYTFSVTDALQTTDNQGFAPFSSSFTTGVPSNSGPIGAGDLQPNRQRLLFTAGNGASTDTRSLTLLNEGETALTISSVAIGGDDAAQFTLESDSAFSLGAGESADITVTFTSGTPGPSQASLQIDSDDELSPSQIIPLGGLSLAGTAEPSLQWLFDAAGIPISTGDPDPSTAALIDAPSSALIGDELSAQAFSQLPGAFKASVEVLGSFTVANSPVVSFGNYVSGSPDVTNELFRVMAPATEDAPANNNQRLQPDLTGRVEPSGDGLIRFDVGGAANGFYGSWRKNDIFGPYTVYSEDVLNTFDAAGPHHVRAYQFKNPNGSVEPNAFILAFEEYTQGFDYNDLVVILRDVVPAEGVNSGGGSGIPGLTLSNSLGLPSRDRMVLSRVDRITGNPCNGENPNCDPDRWKSMQFYDTGSLALRNTGAAPMTLSLSSNQPALFSVSPSSVTVQAGETARAEVNFVATGLPSKGIYSGLINATTGSQTASFNVVGVYQDRPEGSGENYFGDLIKAFGYKTDVGANTNGALSTDEVDSRKAGDEVRSEYWRAANSGAPVVVTQIAAFMPCCGMNESTFDFELFAEGAATHFARLPYDMNYSQSIFPSASGGGVPNTLSVTTSATFRFDISGHSSDPRNGFLGVRFWPLTDERGVTLANTYIVAQDFARGPCGTSGSSNDDGTSLASNCDYNDHVYIVKNIAPIAPY